MTEREQIRRGGARGFGVAPMCESELSHCGDDVTLANRGHEVFAPEKSLVMDAERTLVSRDNGPERSVIGAADHA
jgi:hypothetical protein